MVMKRPPGRTSPSDRVPKQEHQSRPEIKIVAVAEQWKVFEKKVLLEGFCGEEVNICQRGAPEVGQAPWWRTLPPGHATWPPEGSTS